MGFFISRQRESKNDTLYVEIAVGKSNAGTDILKTRYMEAGESKNLYSPIEAAIKSIRIMEMWNKELPEEAKRFRVILDKNDHLSFNYSPKDISKLNEWAETTYNKLDKCIQCSKIFSGKRTKIKIDSKGMDPTIVFEELDKLSFCSTDCVTIKYRAITGQSPEIPINETETEELDWGMYGC